MKHLLLLGLWSAAVAVHADLLDGVRFFDIELGRPVEMGPIQPDRVQGFELLYATPGSGDVSEIAGHLLLRIRLANRSPALSGENHSDLVLSFLADTSAPTADDPALPLHVVEECHGRNWFNLVARPPDGESPLASIWQSLKGLSGGFRIIMDRQTLGHALKSYTVEQDRDLLRYRLLLSPEQEASLLAHLEWVRLHHHPRYYFFSQNCGSFLVQVIGEGIGHENLADFNPWVAPPHSLVAKMIRDGLAVRETPGFYSYRRQALIARNLFTAEYDALIRANPDAAWPSQPDFFHRRDAVRADAMAVLWDLARPDESLHPSVYRLAQWAQTADMLHHHKDWVCEKYTTRSASEARAVQKAILTTAAPASDLSVDVQGLLNQDHAPMEMENIRKGTFHTGLYEWSAGGGVLAEKGDEKTAYGALRGALLTQSMGDASSVAMQRQSSVVLGGFEIMGGEELTEWRATGLKLRKFRDTLLGAPSVFQSTRGWGLGLTVLDARHRRYRNQTEVNLVGGAVLANLAASEFYDAYLWLSIGTDFVYTEQDDHRNGSLRLPLGLESLVTVGPNRSIQWRSSAGVSWSGREEHSDALFAETGIACRLGSWGLGETWLECRVQFDRDLAAGRMESDRESVRAEGRLRFRSW